MPGDYYLFRPLHMAVLAAKDIFLKDNLFASGAVNIFMMAVASFSLYLFANRLVGMALAMALALLFTAQYPGIEMVAWGHISPYLLSLAFFGLALNEVMKGTASSMKRAGVLLLLGALVHEILIVALVFTSVPILYALLQKITRNESEGTLLRRYLVWVVAFPVLVYLGLDILDYFYNGAPPLGKEFTWNGLPNLLKSLCMVSGAPVVAFLTPFLVRLSPMPSGLLGWDFSGSLPLIIGVGGVFGFALIALACLCAWSLRKGKYSSTALAELMALSIFFAFLFGMGYARVYLRGISYLFDATYYYSVTAYIFCLLTAIGLHKAFKTIKSENTGKYLSAVVLVLAVSLIAVNSAKIVQTLKQTWPERAGQARFQLTIGKAFTGHGDEYCMAGFMPGSGRVSAELQGSLLRAYSCRRSAARIPVYVTSGEDGDVWLSSIRKQPIEGPSPEMQAVNAGFEILKSEFPPRHLSKEKIFLLSRDTYTRPDLSLTLKHGLNAAIVLGYMDRSNYAAFRIDGPVASVHFVSNGQPSPHMHANVLPLVRPEYKLEVRHAGPYIYFFIDGNLITFMPAVFEQPGRVGVAFQRSTLGETGPADFMVVESTGGSAPAFNPIAQIPK